MTLMLFNTLSGRLEEFAPLEPGRVRLYTCGPTVWAYAHIGNFRGNLFYDLLKRHLRVSGYQVTHVMNITDIDDRILHEAAHARQTIREYSTIYERAFFEDLDKLRFAPADVYPRATDSIADIIELVSGLVGDGHAYEVDGDVYFRVDSFPAYGALSKLDRRGLRAGARVATDKYEKESASDFALWKRAADGDDLLGAAWPSPWGPGRPGWHIECSAMAMRYLGQTLDIHCGGIDLKFPHHENEIAQSEAFTGETFARVWLHNEMLGDVSGEKMSKSTGNIATLRDLLAAGHDPVAIRYFLIAGAHYRTPLRFDDDGLHSAAEQVRRLRELHARLQETSRDVDDGALASEAESARARYRAALDNDLNLPQGMGHVFDVVRSANAALDRGQVGEGARLALLALVEDADAHLDVLRAEDEALEPELQEMIDARERARAARDFATADRLRETLKERGVLLEDSKSGVRWRRT
ncbi:MAG TPA: cysteine--tRNA ligase [Candidatus Dormibacteraeota bacterium]